MNEDLLWIKDSTSAWTVPGASHRKLSWHAQDTTGPSETETKLFLLVMLKGTKLFCELFSYRISRKWVFLSLGFSAVTRHHDYHISSYKGKHLIGPGLQFQSFSPLSSWWEVRQHPGRHGAESSTSWSKGNSKRLCAILGIAWAYMTSKPTSAIIHFLQQSHTS